MYIRRETERETNTTHTMANLYYYLDMRSPRKDGTGSLKFAIIVKRKAAYSALDVWIKPDEWDADRQQVVKRPDRKFLNVLLKKRMAEATLALQRILLRDDADDLSPKQVVDMVLRGTDTADKAEDFDYVLPVYNEYITLAKKPNTAECYRTSLNNLKEYAKDIDSLRFKDINLAWLKKYSKWLDERGMSVNGANVYLRNLRTVFNYARRNELTKARYPFRDMDMATTVPDKSDVPYEKFLEMVSFPLKDGRAFYRDLFMLSFYLCGIRPVDLLHVKKSQVSGGRLVYWPEKLGGKTKLSIKIEPEAWEIIRRYEGTEHLLKIMDERTDYKAFMQHWNRAMRAIGPDEFHKETRNGREYNIVKHHGIVSYITVYYARTCWATYAYNELDVPMDVISQALGHKSGLKVTNFYVKRGEEKVDKANRALIDKVKADLSAFHES